MTAVAKPGLARGILSAGTLQAAKIGASALLTPLLARGLGTEGYGQYAAAIALIGIAWPLANLGTAHLLTRQIAERPDDGAYQARLISFVAWISVLATLTAAALAGTLLLSGQLLSGAAPLVALLIVGAIIGEQGILFARGALNGLRREDLASLPAATGQIGAAILAMLAMPLGLGLAGAIGALCLGNLIVAAVTLSHMRRLVPRRAAPRSDEPLPRLALIRFGLTSMLYTALAFVLYKADLLLLQSLAGDREAGLYAAAVQWAEFVWFVPLAVQEVVLQATAGLWRTNQREELSALLARLLRHVALATGFLLAMVVALADPLIWLYFGPEFTEVSLATRILAPGVFSFSLARVMWPAIQARGSAAAVPVIGVTVLLNLGLNWALIPHWGALGAAVACCVSYGLVAFAYARILGGYGVRPLAGAGIPKIILLALLTASLVALLARLLPEPLLALAAGGLLGALIYGAGALSLGVLRLDELRFRRLF